MGKLFRPRPYAEADHDLGKVDIALCQDDSYPIIIRTNVPGENLGKRFL